MSAYQVFCKPFIMYTHFLSKWSIFHPQKSCDNHVTHFKGKLMSFSHVIKLFLSGFHCFIHLKISLRGPCIGLLQLLKTDNLTQLQSSCSAQLTCFFIVEILRSCSLFFCFNCTYVCTGMSSDITSPTETRKPQNAASSLAVLSPCLSDYLKSVFSVRLLE